MSLKAFPLCGMLPLFIPCGHFALSFIRIRGKFDGGLEFFVAWPLSC